VNRTAIQFVIVYWVLATKRSAEVVTDREGGVDSTTHQHIIGYTVSFTLYDLHKMDSRQLKMTDDKLQKLSTTTENTAQQNYPDRAHRTLIKVHSHWYEYGYVMIWLSKNNTVQYRLNIKWRCLFRATFLVIVSRDKVSCTTTINGGWITSWCTCTSVNASLVGVQLIRVSDDPHYYTRTRTRILVSVWT